MAGSLPRAIALGYLSAIGALFFNTQPVLVGVYSDAFGFDEQQLGFVLAAGLLGSFVVLCSSFFWIHRLPFRATVAAGICIAGLAQCLLLGVTAFPVVALSVMLFGGAVAVSYAPVLVQIGQSPNAARDFGIAITIQVLVAGVSLILLPAWLSPQFGLAGVVGLFVVVLVSGLILLFFVEVLAAADEQHALPANAKPALICLGAMTIFFVGLNGTWAFIESFGLQQQISRADVGLALSVALFCGVLGSMAASIAPGIRLGAVQIISLIGFVCAAGLMLTAPSFLWFAAGVVAFNVAWNFSLPYFMALMATADPGGRYLSLLPAAQTLGGALGPAIAGSLILGGGLIWVVMQLMIGVLVAYVLFFNVHPGSQQSTVAG